EKAARCVYPAESVPTFSNWFRGKPPGDRAQSEDRCGGSRCWEFCPAFPVNIQRSSRSRNCAPPPARAKAEAPGIPRTSGRDRWRTAVQKYVGLVDQRRDGIVQLLEIGR